MTRNRQLVIWIPPEMKAALDRVKVRDGVNVTEQVRRAIRRWLDERKIETKPFAVPERKAHR